MRIFARCCLALLVAATAAHAGIRQDDEASRARALKDYLSAEKPGFERREVEKRTLLDSLDRLNASQNKIRERVGLLQAGQQEVSLAFSNTRLEVEKQRELEALSRQRLLMLLKIAFRLHRDGAVRFLLRGDSLSGVVGRARVVYRTLRSHSTVTRELVERSKRLQEMERRLSEKRSEWALVLVELHQQEAALVELLGRRQKVLGALDQQQSHYQTALGEYRRINGQLRDLFDGFESTREEDGPQAFPARSTLPLPVGGGRLVKGFGKEVNGRFRTVTFHKGVEIVAEHNAPVSAILPGIVEYEGWVKGLGNVVILHHGSGFYTLSAHLYKVVSRRGARVSQGELIGLVGDTGLRAQPSLYFEIRENAKAVDPLVYFAPKALAALN